MLQPLHIRGNDTMYPYQTRGGLDVEVKRKVLFPAKIKPTTQLLNELYQKIKWTEYV
jgi:hypothetical protein